jgi:hypothetical protein
MKKITPIEFKIKLEMAQAKEWSFKNAKVALKEGYNVNRNNATITELKNTYGLTVSDAENLATSWKYSGLVQLSKVCGLEQIIFIE